MGMVPVIVEDYTPVWRCLETRLGQLAYLRRGMELFGAGDVPYALHSDGRLADLAAELLLRSLRTAGPAADAAVCVEEIGFGSALFARQFLDAFQAKCATGAKDYYERLRYVAVDQSERMVDDAERHAILAPHRSHVDYATGDALSRERRWRDASSRQLPRTRRAFFLNYLLDSLPGAVVRTHEGRLEQLWVRTELPRRAGEEPRREWIDALREGNPETLGDAAEDYSRLVMRCEFRPAGDDLPLREIAPDGTRPQIHAFAAAHCLTTCLADVDEDGFLLVSDYPSDPKGPLPVPDRFGRAVAMPVGFAQLERYLRESLHADCACEAIVQPSWALLLAGRRLPPAVREEFTSRVEQFRRFDPVARAFELRDAGRFQSALDAFEQAAREMPQHWRLWADFAQFCLTTLGNPADALPMAERAVALNPVDGHARCMLGECELAAGEIGRAERTFEKALELGAGARGLAGLAEAARRDKRFGAALSLIASGFGSDPLCRYREVLLHVQNDVLRELAEAAEVRSRVLADRWIKPPGC